MDTAISEAQQLSDPATTTTSATPSMNSAPSYQSGRVLPEKPIVTIQSNTTLAVFNVSNLPSYRELLYFLIWGDLKVRYKQTILGVVWVVMQPLLILGMLARVPTGGLPCPLVVYSGLLPWTTVPYAVEKR
jgi:lipopolysaccharide transport system permease protein